MSDHDLLLADTITTMVTDETDQRVELVADGILWRGTPVSGSTWARDLPQRQDERTPLRDRLAVGGYLHLDRARHRSGEGWARAGRVRLRMDSVSAWWLADPDCDSATDSEPRSAPSTRGTAGAGPEAVR